MLRHYFLVEKPKDGRETIKKYVFDNNYLVQFLFVIASISWVKGDLISLSLHEYVHKS